MRKISLSIALLGLLILCPSSWAWGTKEHILLTRLAVMRILDDPTAPAGLKDFLRASTHDLTDPAGTETFYLKAKLGAEPKDLKGLSYWVVEPDIRANNDRTTKIEPFGVPERLLHFIDLEYLHADVDRQVYLHDLSNRVDLKDVPEDMADPRYQKAGMLPFAVERSFEKLALAFKENRLTPDPSRSKDDDHALKWAGFLAHYAQDNCQPHHATSDYKSVSYFANKRGAPNVHSEMEWRMNDDANETFAELRQVYFKALIQACEKVTDDAYAKRDNVRVETFLIADAAYRRLPMIGLAAMHAAGQAGSATQPTGPAGKFDTEKFFNFTADFDGKTITVYEMKAQQQAMAVARTASLFRRAWDLSQKQSPSTAPASTQP